MFITVLPWGSLGTPVPYLLKSQAHILERPRLWLPGQRRCTRMAGQCGKLACPHQALVPRLVLSFLC